MRETFATICLLSALLRIRQDGLQLQEWKFSSVCSSEQIQIRTYRSCPSRNPSPATPDRSLEWLADLQSKGIWLGLEKQLRPARMFLAGVGKPVLSVNSLGPLRAYRRRKVVESCWELVDCQSHWRQQGLDEGVEMGESIQHPVHLTTS